MHFYKDLAERLEELMQSIKNLSPNDNTKKVSLLSSFKAVYKTQAISFLQDIKTFVPTDHSDVNDGSAYLEDLKTEEEEEEDMSPSTENNGHTNEIVFVPDDEDVLFVKRSDEPMKEDVEYIKNVIDTPETSTNASAVGPNRDNMVNISGLDYELTEVQIKDFFETKCGQVEKVLVSKFKKGPTNCGWASITFANEEAVKKCLGLHKEDFKGRNLSIKRASKQTQNGTIKSVFCAGFNMNRKEEIQQALTKSFENIGVTPTGFNIKQRCAFVHFDHDNSFQADTAVQSSGFQLENGQAVMVDYNLKKRRR